MKRKICVRTITLIAFGISINIIGAFIAMGLRLPVYLDSIGTIMIASLLGPKYAVITGVFGSLISGVTFDVYSLYFAPVQISTGLLAGMAFNHNFLKGAKTPIGVLLFAIPTSFISSIISAFLFGGVTSSGSSYVVQILKVIGFGNVFSVFVTQVLTDYLDKFIAVVLVNLGLSAVPKSLKVSLTGER